MAPARCSHSFNGLEARDDLTGSKGEVDVKSERKFGKANSQGISSMN